MKKVLLFIVLLSLAACSKQDKASEVMMATTTSLNDSGLLDELAPAFKKDTGIELKWLSVGSGEAIQKARDGEVQLLFAHSPKDEELLVKDKISLGAHEIMYNNFLFVGPKELGSKSLKEATQYICENGIYVSRNDNSGTYKKEQATFEEYCSNKKPKNIIETGAGMLETLNIASEKQGYTLTDIATWLANKDKLNLKEAYYNKNDLVNTYSIHMIKNSKFTTQQMDAAKEFQDWVTKGNGLAIIEKYGVEKFNESVFTLIK